MNRFPDLKKVFLLVLVIVFFTGLQSSFGQSTAKKGKVSLPKVFTPTHHDTVPKPKKVLLRSAIIPGWGQAVNKQYWKIPIIYGAFAGLGYFSSYMTQQYHAYRAAYYNAVANPSTNFHTDKRFGPTPQYLIGQSPQALKYYRNYFRNRRDLVYLGIGLVYGLNLLDAYIYAEMRDFNVSNNLSMRTTVGPQQVGPYQALALRLTFHFK